MLPMLYLAGCVRVTESEERGRLEDQVSTSFDSDWNLSGKWEYQEGERVYQLTVDSHGTDRYDWQQGQCEATRFSVDELKRKGIQIGNDREGRFQLPLCADGREAQERWWHARIGEDN